MNQGGLVRTQSDDRGTVHQNVVRRGSQLGQGQGHGFMGGLQDVQAIYLLGIHAGNAENQSFRGH